MRFAYRLLLVSLAFLAQPCAAAEELITSARYPNGDPVPYILNSSGPQPKFVLVLFPGGSGVVDPRMENGRLVYGFKGNFLLRSRPFLVDDDFATVTTNTTTSEERVQALLEDITRRFPNAKVYLAGTSNGTYATIRLAGFLQDRIAGSIHSASLAEIYLFDAKKYRNRHLVIHHKYDTCRGTPFNSAERSHEKFGNDFIAMEGGISVGDPCEAYAHHGFNGIERETVGAIKQWILKGG